MREVATHPLPSLKTSQDVIVARAMLVAKGDVAMDEITDRLDARPPRWRLFEEVPATSDRRWVSQ